MRQEIETKMQELKAKWAGKPEAIHGSVEYIRRKIDRMIYRELKRKLEKLDYLSPKTAQDSLIEIAKEVFEVE